MLRLLPRPPNSLEQVRLRDLLPTRKVPRGDLCVNLDARVGWDQVVRDVVPLPDWDAGLYDGVVFPAYRIRVYSISIFFGGLVWMGTEAEVR